VGRGGAAAGGIACGELCRTIANLLSVGLTSILISFFFHD
jgi:hypothetical protein